MRATDYVVNLLIAVILIVGGYQFYFFSQRRQLRTPLEFSSAIDELIPFWPSWIWIYSGLYYPTILLLVVTINSFERFNYTAFSFIILLAMQLIAFQAYPVRTPEKWRQYNAGESLSMRFLALVHRYDARTNSFPSMHVSVAMLTAMHLVHNLEPLVGYYALLSFLFPTLIGISTLFTKQHYFIDIIPGAGVGYIAYEFFSFYS